MFHQDSVLQQLLKWCIHKRHRSIKQAVQSISHCLAQLLCNEPPWTFVNLTPKHLSDDVQSPELTPQWRMHLQGLGPAIFSRGCPTCDAVWPKAQGRESLSHWTPSLLVLQALRAAWAFHPLLQLSVPAPVTSHIPWPPSEASTEKGCKERRGSSECWTLLRGELSCGNRRKGVMQGKWQFSHKNAGNHRALHQLSERGRGTQQSLFEGRAASVFERGHSVAGRWQSGQCFHALHLISLVCYSFPSRVFFCHWYVPAKLNFLSQIKCISNSLKPRQRLPSPHSLLLWWVPALHSPTVLVSGLLPRPPTLSLPQRWARSVIRKNRNPKIRCQLNQHRAGAGAQRAASFHFISLHASFVLLINKDGISIWKPRSSKSTGHGGTFILKPWYSF